jgi:hypothetical protein
LPYGRRRAGRPRPSGGGLLDCLLWRLSRFVWTRLAGLWPACLSIGELELKFVLHHGSYIVQSIAGHRELLALR